MSPRPARRHGWAWLLGALALAACTEARNDYAELALNEAERAKVAKLQTLFKDTRERVGNVYLAADGCKVYRSREESGAIVAWDLVELAQQGYPSLLTGCSSMTVEEWDGYLVFRVCQQAIGAGGGCQRGGLFRTRDGVTWECASGAVSSSFGVCRGPGAGGTPPS